MANLVNELHGSVSQFKVSNDEQTQVKQFSSMPSTGEAAKPVSQVAATPSVTPASVQPQIAPACAPQRPMPTANRPPTPKPVAPVAPVQRRVAETVKQPSNPTDGPALSPSKQIEHRFNGTIESG